MSADNKKEKQALGAASGMPDLNVFRLPQDFGARVGVKSRLAHVPVTKPRKGCFVRTRPGAEWRMPIAMIVLKDVNESYVVHPSLAPDLPDDVVQYVLVTAITRDGAVFLWPLRVPKSSRQDSWADSAMAACDYAETQWVRVDAKQGASSYAVTVATAMYPEPEWPDESLEQLFGLAFRDRVIDTLDHPVIRRLKGAA